MSQSVLDQLGALSPDKQEAWMDKASPATRAAVKAQDWALAARPEQLLPEGDWMVWLMLMGRGAGKTRSGSEAVKEMIRRLTPSVVAGKVRVALVGQRLKDVRLVQCEGETGLLRCLPPSMLRNGSLEDSWNRSTVELRLASGAIIQGYSSESPGDLRGPAHHLAWVDEPAKLRDANRGTADDTTWSNLMFGLREPPDPRVIVTGTPTRCALIRELAAHPAVHLTRGSTYDNIHNLSERFRQQVVDRYEGTRLGRQELHGEILDDIGTTFQRAWFPIVEPSQIDWWHRRTRLRYWDLAATEPNDAYPDPDWTAGVLVGIEPVRREYVIEHVARFRLNPGERDDRFRTFCVEDGLRRVGVEQEPGSAGKAQVATLGRLVDGVCRVVGNRPTGPKETRAEIVAGAAQQGRVRMIRGDWNQALLDELQDFPGQHDDQVDGLSGAFDLLSTRRPMTHSKPQRGPLQTVPR